MCNSKDVAGAGAGDPPSSSFSDEQLAAFWAGIERNLDVARRMAGRFVSGETIDDVVHTAAILCFEKLQQSPEKLPTTDDHFRRYFLRAVRNHAINCVSDGDRPERPIHANWGLVTEPSVGGHNIADRELDRVFARNDDGKYDAPTSSARPVQNELDELRHILECHVDYLPDAQYEIISEAFFGGQKRGDVAARRGISVHTYDNHLQAAYRALRESLKDVIEFATDIDLPPWYDQIEHLIERYEAAQRRRSSGKKAKVPHREANVPTSKAKAAPLQTNATKTRARRPRRRQQPVES